jgi:hypothetical protein
MRTITASVGPLTAATTNNVALSQTPGAAGSLTINGSLASGGIATIANPQRIKITTTDTTTVFTVTGTTKTGSLLTETLTGTGSGVTSTLDYYTVTKIAVNQGTTAAVTVGTAGTGSTAWVRLDSWADAGVGIQCDVSGTVNYTVQWTHDDPNDPTDPVTPQNVTWINSNDPAAVAATIAITTNNQFSPTYLRVLLNSGTGTVTMKATQYNVANR